MKFTPAPLAGLWIIDPQILQDHRGYFYESFSLKKFEQATGERPIFVQDNQSRSYHGVMRGLHFQRGEHAQAKLVRVISGVVQDVVVDIRPDSATFGKSFSIVLSDENKLQLFVPKGFAHGFLVLSNTAEFFYKCDNFYAPSHESGLFYDDPSCEIEWMLSRREMVISEKDLNLRHLNELER
ncbi:MAG: dTDP-4-dehydrorhamnose 3,5-epimerase [Cytophagales bacterium]|nr:MAG: dTDP-4-dehydrorhamnose 3,5-epimerase [Cytophagales bacterium]TAF62566.1 MAG: dTDP-4-dehydrorhamnose 3,5-epimerase [Cytophagales bacterium]